MKRREAKALGLIRYNTGAPCKSGHLSDRFTSTAGCIECLSLHNVTSRQKEIKRASRHRRRESERVKGRARYRRTLEYQKQRKSDWYNRNSDLAKARYKKWASQNKKHLAFKASQRRLRTRQATPGWLTPEDHEAIRQMYLTCPTGYEVDHIIPIKGKLVCGLHTANNLQHLPAEENRRKFNKFDSND